MTNWGPHHVKYLFCHPAFACPLNSSVSKTEIMWELGLWENSVTTGIMARLNLLPYQRREPRSARSSKDWGKWLCSSKPASHTINPPVKKLCYVIASLCVSTTASHICGRKRHNNQGLNSIPSLFSENWYIAAMSAIFLLIKGKMCSM